MRTVIKLDVTEEQRSALHRLVTGRDTKKLASRKMVTSFVEGQIEGVVQHSSTIIPTSRSTTARTDVTSQPSHPTVAEGDRYFGLGVVSPAEREVIDRLEAEGQNHGYIVGWLKVGRGN